MSEKEAENPPVEEEDEDSGDDDDMGKYMIDDDDEPKPAQEKHPLEKNELLTSSDLRKVIDLEKKASNFKRLKNACRKSRVFVTFVDDY